MKKRFIFILASSLAINVLFVGAFIGFHAHRGMPEMHPPMEDNNTPMTSLDKARCAVNDALDEDPFNAVNLQNALKNLRIEQNNWQEKMHEQMLLEATNASPEERHLLLKKYARPQHKQFAPKRCEHH